MSKLTIRIIPLLFLIILLANAKQASAQGVSAYFGVGSAHDGAATSSGCPPQQIFDDFTGNCEPAPTMGGAFGVFGADFMFSPHLGVNGEYAFRFAQTDFLPLASIKDRPAFYDFNVVYEPVSVDKRIVPVLEGGLGGARVSLYFNQQSCVTSVCSNFNQEFARANHFQLHGGVGVKLYVTPSVFIKPQVDFHWVNNLNQQFGSDFVPVYTVSVGFTFGEH